MIYTNGKKRTTSRGDSIQELAFLDLKYEVDNVRPGMETETLKVLEGVSGQANSGEMLALVRSIPLKCWPTPGRCWPWRVVSP